MTFKLIGVGIFVLLSSLSYIYAGDQGYWYSVIPPLFAVLVALIFNNVFISLIGAILLGAFLVKLPESGGVLDGIFNSLIKFLSYPFFELQDSFNLQVIGFVVCILCLIAVVIVSGGLKAVINYVSKYAKTRKSTNFVTYILGILMFIDDYANTMLIGASMRGLYDKHKISREKLAFIVDSTAAPIAGLVFISTWVGYEVGLLGQVSNDLTLGVEGYAMFFDAVVFRFYCIFALIFLIVNIILDRDFGPMARATHTDSNEESQTTVQSNTPKPNMYVGLVPMLFLVLYVFVGLWVDGGGMKVLSENSIFSLLSFAVWKDVISASENNVTVLFQASLFGLILSMLMGGFISKVSFKKLMDGVGHGVKRSLLPVSILVLAWCIKTVCRDLETGPFLVSLLSDSISPIWFPVILFVIAGITAFTTGTSWGTMAILIPVAIPLAASLDGSAYGMVTIISVAAILDGAIFGDHCSPISDTTIMSSISSGCDHMAHVKTQAPYSVFISAIALLAYFFAGLGVSWVILILASPVLIYFLHKLFISLPLQK